VPAEAAERAPEAEPGQRVGEAGRFDVGRCLGRDLAKEAGQRADEPVERRVALGVVRHAAAESLGGPRGIAPQHHRPAVEARCESAHVRPHQ
jgi:hypothetical protein